jgi:hypothetical protein
MFFQVAALGRIIGVSGILKHTPCDSNVNGIRIAPEIKIEGVINATADHGRLPERCFRSNPATVLFSETIENLFSVAFPRFKLLLWGQHGTCLPLGDNPTQLCRQF